MVKRPTIYTFISSIFSICNHFIWVADVERVIRDTRNMAMMASRPPKRTVYQGLMNPSSNEPMIPLQSFEKDDC